MREKISLILTVLNEEAAVGELLGSLAHQTRPPDQVVVADGGSTDGTVDAVRRAAARLPFPVEVLELSGAGISAGRNAAVRAAHHSWIVCTDAGVRLDPAWLEALAGSLAAGAQAAAGAFLADPHSPFELAMGATVLPLAAELHPGRFLPSSRSVAFTRDLFEAVGGYPEWLDYGEDIVFDLAVMERGGFAWTPEAVAHFRPRSGLGGFFRQYFRYARGDGKALLWTRRHLLRYGVYLLGVPALVAAGWPGWALLAAGGLAYLRRPWGRLGELGRGWPAAAVLSAAAWVPLIRLVGDAAKMLGYPVGLVWRLRHRGRLPPRVRARGSAGGKVL